MIAPAWAGDMRVYTELSANAMLKKSNRRTGGDANIVREILARAGSDAQIEIVPWKRGYQALLTEENVALFPTTLTKDREPLFHWVGPLFRLKWIFLAKRGSGLKINSLDDARKVKSIGTYQHDAKEQFLLSQGFTNLMSTNTGVVNFNKLVEGRVDLVITSNLGVHMVSELAKLSPDEFEVVFTVREVDLYLALSKATDQAIVDEWRAAFESMKEDGTYLKIFKMWQPLESPPEVPLPAE